MTATKTVDAVQSYADAFQFNTAQQGPVGATRLAYNEDGSLRSYYDATGTKHFTKAGQASWDAAWANGVYAADVQKQYSGYCNDPSINEWSDYTIWK
jgi:hypothetical protein